MKHGMKRFLCLGMALLLVAGCASPAGNENVTPTEPVQEAITPTAEPEEVATPTAKPTEEVKPTAKPTEAAQPTATPTPKPGCELFVPTSQIGRAHV